MTLSQPLTDSKCHSVPLHCSLGAVVELAAAAAVVCTYADKTQAVPADTTVVVAMLTLDPAGRSSMRNFDDFSTLNYMN